MGIWLPRSVAGRQAEILTPEALAFVADLHRRFNQQRLALLQRRRERQARLRAGLLPDFPAETAEMRSGEWRVAPIPPDLLDRRVELTGPAERKLIVGGLNSGASAFMADLEDALVPTWENVTAAQVHLRDAVEGTIASEPAESRRGPNRQLATLLVRPRGWHLEEKHLLIDGEPAAAAFFDFGLYLYHNARRLLDLGTGPYFYLPKLESRHEARLYREVFGAAEARLGLPSHSIRATIFIETIHAAFEAEEILYELREYACGLNTGRWDYLFSLIRSFGHRPEFLLPERSRIAMTAPFLRAYSDLVVRVAHRRGALAIGGMSAYIPRRRNTKANQTALARVRDDKLREAADGFDGTWVAHPDLVPVALAVMDEHLGEQPNQVGVLRADAVAAADLLDVAIGRRRITEAGLRSAIAVSVRYLESWLRGQGVIAHDDLMEDAATAELARSLLWQWLRHGPRLDGTGPSITPALVRLLLREEVEQLRRRDLVPDGGRLQEALEMFETLTLGDRFVDFLTVVGYNYLD
jgi:malate synthase